MTKRKQYSKRFDDYLKNHESYNILYPTNRILKLSGPFTLVPEIITLKTHPSQGDVWDLGVKQIDPATRESVYGIRRKALLRIAQAAQIVFDPRYTKRTDNALNPLRIEYQAVGMLRKPDGQWLSIVHSREIDLEVIETEYRAAIEHEAEEMRLKIHKQGQEHILIMGTPECTKEITRQVNAKMLMLKKHKLSYAIAGAYSNVIRSLLLIKDYYTKAELDKPFVVPRVSVDTDRLLADIETRNKMKDGFYSTSMNLYGSPLSAATLMPPVSNSESQDQRISPDEMLCGHPPQNPPQHAFESGGII